MSCQRRPLTFLCRDSNSTNFHITAFLYPNFSSNQRMICNCKVSISLICLNMCGRPSTFAQATKLKRLAVAKEKELTKIQEQDTKGKQSLYDKYGKILLVTKVLIYALLVLWFWSTPVTTVPRHLLQPFGKMFSLRGVDSATGNVVVGILPWLFLTSRVSKLLCQKFSFVLLRP
jgi:hypothetical protein